MVESLVAALVSALCYGIAAVMQAMAIRSASRRPARVREGDPAAGRVDPGLIIRLLGQWRFLISLGIDIIGFLAQLVALRRLPLFAVQAMVASNLAVIAVLAAWLMRARLNLAEWLAVTGVVVGVGLLGASAGAQGATTVGPTFQIGLMVAVAGVGVAGMAAARLPGVVRTPVLGAIAGLGYAVLAVAARILPGFGPGQLVRDPATYTLAAAGIVSFLMYASALESGSVTVATSAVVLCETLPAALVGLMFLGDSTRRGLVGLAIPGFILAVAGAVTLARFGEAGDEPRSRPRDERARRSGSGSATRTSV
jgi:drug/metabolite transporter (DMT)-like permease